MKYIVGGRGCGKTHDIILESAKTGAPILCRDPKQRDMIRDRARSMGVNIPHPVCITEVRHIGLRHMVGIQCSPDRPLKVLVDDPIRMLRELISDSISIECCTLDVESLRDVYILPDRHVGE